MLEGWEIWFAVAPEGPELGASYWDCLIAAWREMRSCDPPSTLSRPWPRDKAGAVSPSKPLPFPPALWKHATVVLALDLLSLKFVPSSAKLNIPLLIKCSCAFSVVASHSILSMDALNSHHFFPSSAVRAVCALRSHAALLPYFVATPCLLPASDIYYKKWSSFQKSQGSVSST